MENPGEFERNEVREEPTEASEAGERLDGANLRPEEVVEFQGNIEEAEAVEQSFTEAVAAGGEERGAPSSQASMPGMEEQGGITISPVSESAAQSGSADEISATPITLPMEDPDGVPDAIADALAVDSDDDEPGLGIVDPDGNTGDVFVGLDDGLEQTGDIRRPPNEDGSLDDLWGAEQGEAVGQMGDPDMLGIELPDEDLGLDAIGGGPGEILDAGLPGPDQAGELGDLASAAAFGADGRISSKDSLDAINESAGDAGGGAGDAGDGSGGTTDDSAGGASGGSSDSTTGGTSDNSTDGSSGSSSGGSSDDSSGDNSGGSSGGGTTELPFPPPLPSAPHPTQSTTDFKTDTSSTMGDDSGVRHDVISGSAFPQSRGSSTGQQLRQHVQVSQSYDPEGTVESAGGEPDRTLGGLVEDPVPDVSPTDEMDLQESMSQPVGEEGTRSMESTPPPELGEQALSGNLDPAINWGDSGGQGGGEVDVGQFDADDDLTDPPEPDTGGGMQEAASDEP